MRQRILTPAQAQVVLDRLLTRIYPDHGTGWIGYRCANDRELALITNNNQVQIYLDRPPKSTPDLAVVKTIKQNNSWQPFRQELPAPALTTASQLVLVQVDSAGALWHLISWYEADTIPTMKRAPERHLSGANTEELSAKSMATCPIKLRVNPPDCNELGNQTLAAGPAAEHNCEPAELTYQETVANRYRTGLWFPDDDPVTGIDSQSCASQHAHDGSQVYEAQSNVCSARHRTLSLRGSPRQSPRTQPNDFSAVPTIRYRRRVSIEPPSTASPTQYSGDPIHAETHAHANSYELHSRPHISEPAPSQDTASFTHPPRAPAGSDDHEEANFGADIDTEGVDEIPAEDWLTDPELFDAPGEHTRLHADDGIPEWLALAPDDDDLAITDNSAKPDLFEVDTDTRTLNKVDAARLLAYEVAETHSRSTQEMQRVLTDIFLASPWSATRRAVERCLSKGADAATLENAAALREVWQRYPEFWVQLPYVSNLGDAWQQSEAARSRLGWDVAITLASSWNAHPDPDELEQLLIDLYYHWRDTWRSAHWFSNFQSYLTYRAGCLPGSMGEWIEWSFEPDHATYDPLEALDEPGARQQFRNQKSAFGLRFLEVFGVTESPQPDPKRLNRAVFNFESAKLRNRS